MTAPKAVADAIAHLDFAPICEVGHHDNGIPCTTEAQVLIQVHGHLKVETETARYVEVYFCEEHLQDLHQFFDDCMVLSTSKPRTVGCGTCREPWFRFADMVPKVMPL